ncbi:restriction endonuclease [Synechococcus sp. PCC 7502]|uniref:HNH endonuclease n=1 Tax=Synechococcus sp. PCC 7502 TaxID=1173263 RepID=UPI00029FA0C8|nr:HNH endonuclease signature motif containing protein [Synechococcus sp. PCC 7502]AFY74792.1 restriction endonuclease [Synechococcus sp. PCC 7502]
MSRPYISVELDRNIRNIAKHRCGYCLSPQKLVMARLEIEHIIPISKGGSNEESNLWLACPICNSHKAGKIEAIDPVTDEVVALFNPRTQDWSEHFAWSEDGIRIVGKTATGRATVKALRLDNDLDALEVRSYWVQAGWHPPEN